MKIEPLVDILHAAGVGVKAKTIFVHELPDVKEGVLFRMPLQGVPVDHELPGRYTHRFQVIVRSQKTQVAEDKAEQIVELLTMQERAFPGMHVTYMRANTLPIVYPRSAGNSVEASINFETCYILG